MSAEGRGQLLKLFLCFYLNMRSRIKFKLPDLSENPFTLWAMFKGPKLYLIYEYMIGNRVYYWYAWYVARRHNSQAKILPNEEERA